MSLLSQQVGYLETEEKAESLFRRLPEALQTVGFKALQVREDVREIEFECLILALNFVLWRFWADKAVLRLKPSDHLTTRVELCCVPNLRRYKIRRGEQSFTKRGLEDIIRRIMVPPVQ
jgi:hypothetical protein